MRRVARLACQLAALIAVAAPASCQPESLVLDVPYVHQVYDVPEWFDGRCSCGAAWTSWQARQVLPRSFLLT